MIKARNRIDKNIELENCNIIKILMMISVIIYHSTIFWSSTTWFNQAPVFQSNVLAYISEWLGEIGADPGIRCSNHKCITRSELYVPLHGKVGDRCPYCDAALEMQL